MSIIDINKIKTTKELERIVRKALVGKTLGKIDPSLGASDEASRTKTKGHAGYAAEGGYFGIKKNSKGAPDLSRLGVEIKTCPLKYSSDRRRLSVKEPLSLNIINYHNEVRCRNVTESTLYKKNKKILFICYIHDKKIERSKYVIKYVFLWKMDRRVLNELRQDYKIITDKIRAGRAHEIHQSDNLWLTLCPKHNGDFKNPRDKKSKTTQPFGMTPGARPCPAEIRAFRLKSRYMNRIVSAAIGERLEKGGWRFR